MHAIQSKYMHMNLEKKQF